MKMVAGKNFFLVSLDESDVVRVVAQLRIPLRVSDVFAVETVGVARFQYLVNFGHRPVLVCGQSQPQQVPLSVPSFSHHRRFCVMQ